MATRAKKTATATTQENELKAHTDTPQSEPQTSGQNGGQNEKQSQLATILVGLLIIASGLLIYNYFQHSNTPEVTNQSEQQEGDEADNQQATEDQQDTNSPSESESTEGQYTVVSGDSLWSIAEKVYGSGFDWTKIRDANELNVNAHGQPTVEIGQVLNIPDSAAISQQPIRNEDTIASNTESDVAGVQELRETPSTAIQTYTVQHGDTLWSIAQSVYGNGDKWEVIFNDPHNQIGQLPNGRPLVHAGNVLYIPELL